jgi:predicted small lipoprotein YifL
MKRQLGIFAVVVAVALSLGACGEKKPAADATKEKASAEADAKVKEAVEIATAAYVYGYSLITTEVTRVQMSNVPKIEGLRAPMSMFLK